MNNWTGLPKSGAVVPEIKAIQSYSPSPGGNHLTPGTFFCPVKKNSFNFGSIIPPSKFSNQISPCLKNPTRDFFPGEKRGLIM